MNHMNAITIWFTGLSASGKTTLSTQLFKDLKGLGVDNVILLDGEKKIILSNYQLLPAITGTKTITPNKWFDDLSVPDRFEKQIDCLKNDPALSIVGGYIEEFLDNPENKVGLRVVPLSNDKILHNLKLRSPMNQVSVLFRKSDVISAGGYLDWHFNEDYYLWIRMFLKGCTFKNIPETLVKVRIGKNMYRRRGGIKYFVSE